ncbi:MAG: hypothetical protein ACRDNT_15290, partial [Streptosporangiaceae bacterium]
VADAAVVAILGTHRTLGVDAATFGMSALIVLIGGRTRPVPGAKERHGLPCGPYRRTVSGSSSAAACC